MTPTEFVADPGRLAIELTINGVLKQGLSTAQTIFNVLICASGSRAWESCGPQ